MKSKNQNLKFFWTVILAFLSCWLYLFFTACSNYSENEKVIISKKEYQALKGDSTALLYPKKLYIKGLEYNIERGSDGHEYYFLLISTGSVGQLKPFHYPGCVICNKTSINETTSNKN